MNEEMSGNTMERRTPQGVVQASASSLSRNSSSKETVFKGRQQWRGGSRRQYYPNNSGNSQPRGRYDNKSNQQYRQYDKRPTPRGEYQNVGNRNNNNGEVDMPVVAEKGSTGSKKLTNSLNYLLNFKYAPRERVYDRHARFTGKKYSHFNKERFLQANCQFIVNDSAEYTVYGVDPDILVDWSLIEQVRIFSHDVPSCPICLYPPKAAKITRCGHVYCWSCILHYLSLSDKPWRKCPICYESIVKQDLKSVCAMENHHFSAGETITMRLMKKTKNTTLALPISQWQDRQLKPFSINDSLNKCYCKLLLASASDVLTQIIEGEETSLNVQMSEAKLEQSPEICFIESALSELKVRKDQLQGKKKSTDDVCETLEKLSLPSSDEGSSDEKSDEKPGWNVYRPEQHFTEYAEEYEAAFSDDENASGSTGSRSSSLTLDQDTSTLETTRQERADSFQSSDNGQDTSSSQQDETCSPIAPTVEKTPEDLQQLKGLSDAPQDQNYSYFYQADDGQNIFLHPINARCLIKEYGSLDKCPEYITAKVLEMEAMSQTEETRKRYRYLNHLPLTCEFVICELDLKSPVISNATLDYFRVEIQKRKQRRQKKIKVEKRRELKVDAKMATLEGRPAHSGRRSIEKLNLTSDEDFPSQSGLAMIMSPLGHKPGPFTQISSATTTVNDSDESFLDVVVTEASGLSPPSFAQALRIGKATEITKTVKKQAKEEGQSKIKMADGEDSDEDYIPPPTYQSTFSDALSIAISESLENHLKNGQSVSQTSGSGSGGGGGKRPKKPKKKLLFTTGHMKFN